MSFPKGFHPKTEFRKGQIPWIKGKTKEKHPQIGAKSPPWCRGLTKEIDIRLQNIGLATKTRNESKIILSLEEKQFIDCLYNKLNFYLKEIKELLGYSYDQLGLRMDSYGLGRRPNHSGLEKGRQKIGFKHSEKTRKLLASYKGELASNWKGGISFEPYTEEFNKQLKELIRQRDNYTCQLCGIPECECKQHLCCHHIDYNKKKCLPTNLVSICHVCGGKVHGDREYWQSYFEEKMKTIQEGFQLKLKIKEEYRRCQSISNS